MTLGYSQNNPSNLIKGTPWEGVVDSDNDFAAFSSMPYGIRAWLMNLHAKIGEGYNTYRKYITVFAPPSQNDTATYLQHIENAGFNLDDSIALDTDSLKTFFKAQIKQEIAPDDLNVTDEDIDSGFSMFSDSIPGFVLGIIADASNAAGPAWLPIAIISFLLFLFLMYYFYQKKHK